MIERPVVSRLMGGFGPNELLLTAKDRIFESSINHNAVSIMLEERDKVQLARFS